MWVGELWIWIVLVAKNCPIYVRVTKKHNNRIVRAQRLYLLIYLLIWQDWRGHADEMHSLQRSIEEALKETSMHLTRLHDEISRTLEKVATREKYLNTQLEHHLVNFRLSQDRLAEMKEQCRQASGGVSSKTRTLADVRIVDYF